MAKPVAREDVCGTRIDKEADKVVVHKGDCVLRMVGTTASNEADTMLGFYLDY